MRNVDNVSVVVNPQIADDQLFSFYQQNHICEEGYGRITYGTLRSSSLIVGAFEDGELVGIARAMFDGMAGVIMEFCVALEYQGEYLEYENGSLVGKDEYGLGRRIGEVLLGELFKMGADFIFGYIVEDYEESFYESLGFTHNTGHLAYYIDKRPYKDDERYITKRRSRSTGSDVPPEDHA